MRGSADNLTAALRCKATNGRKKKKYEILITSFNKKNEIE